MQEAETLFIGTNGKIRNIYRRMQTPVVRSISSERNHILPHMPSFIKDSQISVARKYEQITYLLGLGRGGCGKTMGLAGYGKPLFDPDIYKKSDFFDFSLKYKDLLEQIFAVAALSGKSYKEFVRHERANIASTVQYALEQIFLNLIEDLLSYYPSKNLVLSGGIFLNCLLNHKIIKKFDLDNFFVMPPSGDDGHALGVAYYAYSSQFGQTQFAIDLPYIGISYDDSKIEQVLKDVGLKYLFLTDNDLAEAIAKRIANNKILAIHRGRTEIGPRALCHRSILANPTNPDMKDILNNKVKHREPFRPFAPAVIAEEQFTYFDLKFESKYMLMATMVKEEFVKELPAITHIDGTARVQAISKESEPFIHSMLLAVKRHIGFPIVINTSFNVNGEPIVESPHDAVETFLKTQIDSLVIGNFIIDKPEVPTVRQTKE